MKVLIVEDEPIIADDIAISLEELGYQIADICDNADGALRSLKENDVDIVLLDINIKGSIDGIQLAHRINADFVMPFIFVSSLYDSSTLARAKNTNPAGYIVKPFKDSDLQVHIELALSKNKIANSQKDYSTEFNRLFVRKEGAIVPLDFEAIEYVEADDNYANFYIGANKYVVSHTLKQVEEKLQPHGFCRIHKTYLVNMSKIDRIEHSVVFIGEKMLPIGKVYRKPFMDMLTIM